MARRQVDVIKELPRKSKRLLNAIGVDLGDVQDWLNTHKIDGCTVAPDLYLVVCAWHDWACRQSVLPRWLADRIATQLILHVAMDDGDEWLWHNFGYIYAPIFYLGVRVGALLKIGVRKNG